MEESRVGQWADELNLFPARVRLDGRAVREPRLSTDPGNKSTVSVLTGGAVEVRVIDVDDPHSARVQEETARIDISLNIEGPVAVETRVAPSALGYVEPRSLKGSALAALQ
jgi:hypothetical protein